VRKVGEEFLRQIPSLKSLVVCFILACAFGSSSAAEAGPVKVIVLTDAAGLGDKGFNDVCWQGVLRAQKEFGVE